VGGLLGEEAGVAGGGAADEEAEAGVVDRPAVGEWSVGAPAAPASTGQAAADPAVEDRVGA